jgi:UDP-3-O-[3-hydroxymyristoyl] glucosamine N-acyltransferase
VTLAGQVGTVGHVTIGRGTTVAARGVVTNDVEPGSFVSGFPLKPHAEERKILASMRKLPDLIKKVRDLEKRLEDKE